jgi:alpha-amylase
VTEPDKARVYGIARENENPKRKRQMTNENLNENLDRRFSFSCWFRFWFSFSILVVEEVFAEAAPMMKASWLAALLLLSCSSKSDWQPGQPLTLDVSGAFAAGTALRDRYGGSSATVSPSGSVTLTPDAAGVVLLERDGAQPTAFNWADATVYFVITDRFFNGDPSNDNSYGRSKDGAQEVGTWHGGDLKGLTAKLDYIASLGATAVWISPIVEQVHGWVAGGSGDFKHYGYHGYWALDFTQLDANLGTSADLTAFVDRAHQLGIRVLLDVVMNHPGYATGDDLVTYLPQVFRDGTGNAFRSFTPYDSRGWLAWNDLVDYKSANWQNWWSPKWIRAGLGPSGMFDPGGSDDLTRSLNFLPDFKTENPQPAGVPAFFSRKSGTGFTTDLGYSVRQYLVKWQTDWVRQYGIDGFRCDTAKNVEMASWAALKQGALAALRDWKTANPGKKLDDSPFWMTGEVYGHGVAKDGYFTDGGFDSLINFEFQPIIRDLLTANASLAAGATSLDALYAKYAGMISTDPAFDVLSYLSSHDTHLFLDVMKNDAGKQRQAGTALLLAPGGAQIFYGDESGRALGPALSDAVQGTRSDMNWVSPDTTTLAHFQKLADFRKRHAAVGAGSHQKLNAPSGTYAFARKLDQDAVVVVLTPPGAR